MRRSRFSEHANNNPKKPAELRHKSVFYTEALPLAPLLILPLHEQDCQILPLTNALATANARSGRIVGHSYKAQMVAR